MGVSAALLAGALTARADITHRYSFNDGTANDSVGGVNGTLMNTATVSGGALQLNNPNFSGPGGGYLALNPSILPSSGSATIEQWFTFTGSGFFTEGWAFSDRAGGANPPGPTSGQYLMHTISNPQGGPNAGPSGGSSVAQALNGYQAGSETRAYMTTPNIGAGGGGYLDDGGTYMSATVIDGVAGTLSYYLFRASDGAGGLQETIAAIPLSSYSFTDAFLGRSPFDADNSTSGSIDEFRIYNNAQSAASILADFNAGPNTVLPVPEPSTWALLLLGATGMFPFRRRIQLAPAKA